MAGLLYLGTEFGLWVSVDDGKNWAQYKGSHFPAVSVRDVVVQPRANALVLATHGRGIWVVDDITPLRALTPEILGQEAAFIPNQTAQQRILGNGGWAPGAATFIGDNPPDGAVITYYQKARHLFGKLKLEVVDSSGRVVDELPASKRPGLNRVTWSMTEKAPRVPPAAQIAFAGTRGPRVLPGVYTIRMTKNGKVMETKLNVGLDPRAKFSESDRKAQYDAAMKVHTLFGDESALMDRILGLRAQLAKTTAALPANDALTKQVKDFDTKVDNVRKQIVATTEGGAITGEERLREHTDQLYGAILSYDGKPADYQMANIEALQRELTDVTNEFQNLSGKELDDLNNALKAKGAAPLTVPASKTAAQAEEGSLGGGRVAAGQGDPDSLTGGATLPASFRLLH